MIDNLYLLFKKAFLRVIFIYSPRAKAKDSLWYLIPTIGTWVMRCDGCFCTLMAIKFL